MNKKVGALMKSKRTKIQQNKHAVVGICPEMNFVL
jgi:hypothetical protein